MTDKTTTAALTFEDGYQRLQQIAGRLNEEEVPVSEMCDLFAEGKGLEQALTDYLDTQRSRVEAIQKGEGIRAFTITSQTAAPASPPAPLSSALAPGTSFELNSDDSIPF